MLKTLVKFQNRVATRERGATAVEYALMVALIAVFIIVAVQALGTSIADIFGDISDALDGAGG